MEGRGAIIKYKYIYNTHWQASDIPRLFLSAMGGGSLSVGGVVLRSDSLARELTNILAHHGVILRRANNFFLSYLNVGNK